MMVKIMTYLGACVLYVVLVTVILILLGIMTEVDGSDDLETSLLIIVSQALVAVIAIAWIMFYGI